VAKVKIQKEKTGITISPEDNRGRIGSEDEPRILSFKKGKIDYRLLLSNIYRYPIRPFPRSKANCSLTSFQH
jgi:hypothetical protein